MKLLITGSNRYNNYVAFKTRVLKVISKQDPKDILIVNGGSEHGVDKMARELANELSFPCKTITADWEKEGNRAGMLRNEKLVSFCSHALLFIDDKTHPNSISLRELCNEFELPTIVINVKVNNDGREKQNNQSS